MSENKKKKWELAAIVICFAVMAAAAVAGRKKESKTIGYSILRPSYGTQTEKLLLAVGDRKESFSLPVKEKAADRKELNDAFEKVWNRLEALFQAYENEDIAKEQMPKLPKEEEALDAGIRWEYSDPDMVDREGRVLREKLTSPETLVFTARVTIQEECRERQFSVEVRPYPPGSAELLFFQAEEELLRLEEESRTGQELVLPEKVFGVEVSKAPKNKAGFWPLLLLGLMVPVLLWIARRSEKQKKEKDREEYFLSVYPSFVTKLTLFIGAGLSIRGSMERLAADCKARETDKKTQELSEELALLAGELKNGVSESEAYDHFGRRIGYKPYQRCSALLISQLQKGAGGLLPKLEYEARVSWDKHRRQAEKKGEEAQTKLLFPMIGMLFLVFAIIMIPAFFNMNG